MRTFREDPEMKFLEAEVSLALQGTGSPSEEPFLSGIPCQLCHLSLSQLSPLHRGGRTYSCPEASLCKPRQRAHAGLLPHTVCGTHFLPRPPDMPVYRVPWDLSRWEQMSQTALQEGPQLGHE